MSVSNSFGERLKLAVQKAGGLKAVARELGRGESTFYTYFNEQSSPSVADANRICEMGGVRPAWLLSGDPPMDAGPSRAIPSVSREHADVIDVPILSIAASAGPGRIVQDGEAVEETVPLPTKWLRRFGTPSSLKIVEIVGGSMTPPLEDGDWVLINTDRTELREGIAVVRYDESLFIKRIQPEGKRIRLTSSAEGYEPKIIDLSKEPNALKIIGYAEGRWRPRGLA